MELTSHAVKAVALVHPKVIKFQVLPYCTAHIRNSVLGTFEIWISRLLYIHVVANHVIGCGSRMVFLHIKEGLPCVLIGITDYLELQLAVLQLVGRYGEH